VARVTQEFIQQLQAFERDLDARLATCAVHGMNADQALGTLMYMSEHTAARDPMANGLDKAIEVFAPYLVSGAAGTQVDVERLVDDCQFGAHYYMLREYLYYSFNAPDAFAWSVDGGHTDINFLDRSIPRQFHISHSEAILGARHHFQDDTLRRQLEAQIRGRNEWELTDAALDALLQAEADHKLAAYFSMIAPDSQIDLGGYTYAQFHTLYRMLLMKALWHRYHTQINGQNGSVHMDEAELVAAAQHDLGLAPETTARILRDLIYDAKAAADRLSPGYFSLMREGGSGRIWMRPVHFCLYEGVVGLLRVVAQRRSRTFLSNVSGPLGAGLVDRVAAAFEAQGFACLRDVQLAQYDPALPDIDLLVISNEPTLGFVLLVCELKSPLPSLWAKDHLRALNPDSVSKAFVQCQRIGEFLTSENGLGVLRQLLPNEGLRDFDHFVVVMEPLVITSHNGGMFFDAMRTPVFAYNTMERMLRASDGDMAYIQHMLRTFTAFIDEHVVVARRDTALQHTQVSYDVVDVQVLIQFPPNQWRSDGTRDAMIDDFLQGGLQPCHAFWWQWQRLTGMTAEQATDAGPPAPDAQPRVRRTVVLFDGNEARRGWYVAREAEDPEGADPSPEVAG